MRICFNPLKIIFIGVLITVIIITSTVFLSSADRSRYSANTQFNNKISHISLNQITTLTNTSEFTHHIFLPLIAYNPYFTASVRKLTACENQGRHHLFIQVINSNGEGMSNIPIKVSWSSLYVIRMGSLLENQVVSSSSNCNWGR